MKRVIAYIAILLASPASAQQIDGVMIGAEKGFSLWALQPTITPGTPHPDATSITFGANVVVVTADGKVSVDWKRAEEKAKNGCPPAPADSRTLWVCDNIGTAIARLMLAIRDKTYTEIGK